MSASRVIKGCFCVRIGPSESLIGHYTRKLPPRRLHAHLRSVQACKIRPHPGATPPLPLPECTLTHLPTNTSHHPIHPHSYLTPHRPARCYPAHPSWYMSSGPRTAQSEPRQQTLYEAKYIARSIPPRFVQSYAFSRHTHKHCASHCALDNMTLYHCAHCAKCARGQNIVKH
jgi:hypothetical protein